MSANGLSDERLRTMQIIAGALMMGVISFAAVAVFMGLQKEVADPFIAYIAAGFAVLMFVVHLFVPPMISNGMISQLRHANDIRDESSTAGLIGAYQTHLIIALAMLEGAAFFNLVAYIIAVQWWSLVIVGMLLLAMAMKFPTRFKVESWIETKQHELEMGH